MSLIHKRQNYLGVEEIKRYYIVIDELIVNCLANKAASNALKQQLETIAVIGLFERLTNSHSSRLECSI